MDFFKNENISIFTKVIFVVFAVIMIYAAITTYIDISC